MNDDRISEPHAIEQESMRIIRAELASMGKALEPEEEPVVLRAIHTSADFDYAENLVFGKGSIQRGIEALRAGKTVVTDTAMAQAGINAKALARFKGLTACYMADPEVAAEARRRNITRAVVSMERAAYDHPDAIFAIGNAPTALLKLCDLIEDGLRPSLVVGVPVGFVNVVESKEKIIATAEKHEVPYIVARGRKGGSPIAATIVNALLYIK